MRLLMNPLLIAACACLVQGAVASPQQQHDVSMMDVSSQGFVRKGTATSSSSSATMNVTATMNEKRRAFEQHFPFEEMEAERIAKKERMKRRRESAAKHFASIKPNPERLERVDPEDWEDVEQKQQEQQHKRELGSWFSGSGNTSPYSTTVLADPSADYDMWAQGYRMLGGFIDCDHSADGDDHSGDEDGDDGNDGACSRWMMWAAYVNPNYSGSGYDEYYGDDAVGKLDCHSPNTEWELLGVYRQEFYQYIEQISKHVWAIDDYEYVVALAGLAYMTDEDCTAVGTTSGGSTIYAGVAPQQYGKFQMALYTDEYCIEPDDSTGYSYSDLVAQGDIDLGSQDATDDDSYSWASEWWYATQEYTLENLNDVYEDFKYCTSCVDYPTYQDGYFIGDDGTDEDDVINQCWKFYSHDSYTCEADCIAKAHAQGTILSVQYGQATFGKTISGFYQESSEKGDSAEEESGISRLAANAFLTLSFLLFVATFLAFAVARRSRYRESRSTRSRRLLDDETDAKSSKSRKSTSKSKSGGGESDGLFRGNSSRSKSKDRKSKRSSSKSSTRKKRSSSRPKSYEPPSDAKASNAEEAF